MSNVNDVDDLADGDEEQEEDSVPGFEVSREPLGSKAINYFAMKLVQCGEDTAVLKRIMGRGTDNDECRVMNDETTDAMALWVHCREYVGRLRPAKLCVSADAARADCRGVSDVAEMPADDFRSAQGVLLSGRQQD